MTDANTAHGAIMAEQSLPVGTVLSGGQFTITEQIGAGGFGITYRAADNVLGRTIVIKECFPSEFCVRDGVRVLPRSTAFADPVRRIVEMFMREARSLARLRHPNIVGVHGAFEENDTAYMVLDLIDGRDLYDILTTTDTPLSPGRIRSMLLQMLDAIEKVHEMGLLHRDISPDNIIIDSDGTPVLIDFGAARADASRHTRALSAMLVVKDGYSPQEFYVAGSEQMPCSDLYALGATFYQAVSGQAPPNSQTRMVEIAGKKPDPCVPLAGRIKGYDEAFLQAIDSAMEVHPSARLQSAAKWRALILQAEDHGSAPNKGGRIASQDVSLELETSLTRLVEETNDEVRRISQIPAEPKKNVTAPPMKSEKPEWVDEFNETSESLSRPITVGRRNLEKGAATIKLKPRVAPGKTQSETNWIERAAVKQERIRSEQEAQYQLFLAEQAAGQASTPSPEPQQMDDGWEDAQSPPVQPQTSRVRSLAVFFALLACFWYLFFLDVS